MNPLAWTALIVLVLGAISALLQAAERLVATFRTRKRLRSAREFTLCCAIGLLAALLYFIGFEADLAAGKPLIPIVTSTR